VNWVPFYAALAGSTAAVMGLLFIAVQLSMERLPADELRGWQSVAFCTFYLYLTGFFLPLWFLMPSFGTGSHAVIALIVSIIGIVRIARASIPIWHGVLRIGGNRWWQMLWYSVGPLILYMLIVYQAGMAYFGQWQDVTEQNVAIVLVILFSLALRNSWKLFVEAAFQIRDRDKIRR
jgi:hypothetical protein